MIRFPPLLTACFIKRENRFRSRVLCGGREEVAHLPNSGRLEELLVPGARCWVSPRTASGRTSVILRLVEHSGELVSVDSRLPPYLVEDAWQWDALGEWLEKDAKAWQSPAADLKREVARGRSRLDLRLTGPAGTAWVETKSVTCVQGGIARFPDAPTLRGRRHVAELQAARGAGDRAAILFVVQRPGARAFEPHEAVDPAFGAALRAAATAGVALLAWRCSVSLEGVALAAPIPVLFPS